MSFSLNQMLLFHDVLTYGSFTQAAKANGLSKATVSKQIVALEKSLRCKLIVRNTRRLAPTFVGDQLFQHAKIIVREYQAALDRVSALQEKPKGKLCLSAPAAFADHLLAPILPKFFELYPEIQLEMRLTGQLLDLGPEKIDLAIRLTHTPPHDKFAQRLGDYQFIICASKAYLSIHGRPNVPTDLNHHKTLVYATQANADHWLLVEDGREHRVHVQPVLQSNTYKTLLEAVLRGAGIARLPSYVVKSGLQSGQLCQLFSDLEAAPIPIYAIYSQRQNQAPMNLRVFLEFLTTELRQSSSLT